MSVRRLSPDVNPPPSDLSPAVLQVWQVLSSGGTNAIPFGPNGYVELAPSMRGDGSVLVKTFAPFTDVRPGRYRGEEKHMPLIDGESAAEAAAILHAE